MLIEFSVKNFRSIRDTQTISMVAGPGAELLQTNSFDPKLKGIKRLLRSGVIYGPNAAGKTNMLRALQFMRAYVVDANLLLAQGQKVAPSPFLFSSKTRNEPSEFEVTFGQGGIRYQYGFALDSDLVHYESLIAFPYGRPQRLFERSLTKGLKPKWSFSTKFRGNKVVLRDATRANALFLPTAVQLNNEQLQPIFDWFKSTLVVVTPPTVFNQALTLNSLKEVEAKSNILGFLQGADLAIRDLELKRSPLMPGTVASGGQIMIEPGQESVPHVVSVTSFHQPRGRKKPVPLPMEDESAGTQAVFTMTGPLLNVLRRGEVLLIDEIDTHLHPLLVRYLIEQFHGATRNPRNAQLFFTTHDVTLLDTELFRRDQVWFVEKREEGQSVVYPLSDFKVRKEERLARGYLRGRYGALPMLTEVD